MNPRFSGGFIFTVFKEIAMKRTTNYALPTWEKSDFIQMDDFNDLTQKTDAALKANADAAGSKADGAATSAALAALTKNLGAAGHNCRIAFGEYTGTGTTGADNPNMLNFDFYPVLLVVASATRANSSNRPHFFLRPRTVANSPYAGTSEPVAIKVTWADDGISWYVTSGKETHQLNTGGTVYYYTVLGYDKNSELSE